MGIEIIVRRRATEALSNLFTGGVEVDRFCQFTGALGGGLFVAENDLLQFHRPASVGLTKPTGEHVDHAFRPVDRSGLQLWHIGRLDAAGDEEHAHVADDLRGRGDLDDVAEEQVHLGVSAGDFAPLVT